MLGFLGFELEQEVMLHKRMLIKNKSGSGHFIVILEFIGCRGDFRLLSVTKFIYLANEKFFTKVKNTWNSQTNLIFISRSNFALPDF